MLFTNGCQTTVSTEHVAHFFEEIRMQLPFPLHEKHHLIVQTNNTNIDDGAEALSFLGFILLYYHAVVANSDTILLLHEMGDNYLIKSDNYDTQRLYLNVNLRVVLTFNPRDKTVTHLLYNKPITDELMANLALALIDLIHFAPLILQKLCNALLSKREEVVWRFFYLMAAITQLTIERAPDADPKRPASTFYRSPFLVNAIPDMIPTKDKKGTYFCSPSRTSLMSSSATHRCSAQTPQVEQGLCGLHQVACAAQHRFQNTRLDEPPRPERPERGQAVGTRLCDLFTMPSTFVLSASTVLVPDI